MVYLQQQVLRIPLTPGWCHLSPEIDVDPILFVDDSLGRDELHSSVEGRTYADRDHVVKAVGKRHLAPCGEVQFVGLRWPLQARRQRRRIIGRETRVKSACAVLRANIV